MRDLKLALGLVLSAIAIYALVHSHRALIEAVPEDPAARVLASIFLGCIVAGIAVLWMMIAVEEAD